jgi:uncharacterized coiled-coil protein SlyX
MDSKQLKRKSKQGTIISLVGFVIVILVFVFAAKKLTELNDTIITKTNELDSLNSTISLQKNEIDANKELMKELVNEINKLKDPNVKPNARAVEIPGVKDSQGRQIYDFTVWITSSQHTLNKIKNVSYQFGHDTFIIRNRKSSDKSNGFLVSYRGWGCLSVVKLSVEYKSNEIEEVYFDMCDSISW